MASPRYIRPARDRFIVERLSDGSVAVFDRSGDAVHSLNPAAAAVWACCAEPASVDDLSDALAEGTANPPGVEVIDAAVRQLLGAGLLQEVQGASAALPLPALSSRRQALKRIAGGAAVALPVILTLAGKEQRLLAQGCGSPTLVNLTGCWDLQDGDGTVLNLTQSGNTITGTITGVEEGLSGTVSGTLCGTTLDVTINAAIGPTCTFRVVVHSTNVTNNAFSGTAVGDFAATGCDFGGGDNQNGAHFEDEFSAVRGCPPA
jgi:hypothetical protein